MRLFAGSSNMTCKHVNIPGPLPVLLNWPHRSSVFWLWHRFLYFFLSCPLCCLFLRSSSNSRPSTSLMLPTALWLYLPTLLAFSHQESHQSPALAQACWLSEPWEVSLTCRWRMKKTTMTWSTEVRSRLPHCSHLKPREWNFSCSAIQNSCVNQTLVS